MRYHRLSRRHLLQGLGGATLALPLLPSLMGRAEAQGLTAPRFFASTWVGHGGVSQENAYPIASTVSLTSSTLYPAGPNFPVHQARSARLVDLKRTHAQTAAARAVALPDFDNGAARVSPLLGSFFPDALLQKLNVVRGIDMLTWGGHTRGYLGNFTNRDGGFDNGLANAPVPSLDWVLAQSTKFYSAAERAQLKAPAVMLSGNLSSMRSGSGVAGSSFRAGGPGELYDLVFAGVARQQGQVDPRVGLVDRVYADYSRTAKGAFGPGRRLSSEDRVRLTEYMDTMKQIGDRMRASVPAGCSPPTLTAAQRTNGGPRNGEADWEWNGAAATPALRLADQKAALQLMNTMIINAFLCGTTRIVVQSYPSLIDQFDPAIFNTASQFEAQRTDPHAMVFHNHPMPDRQRLILETQRVLMEFGFMDLMARMNTTQVLPGVSLLDQSVLYWGSESGHNTHDAKGLPTLLAGSGGGYFKTGNYVDYTHDTRLITGQYGTRWYAGLPQNRLLANLAQAMGLAPDDYELSDAAYATKFPARGGKVPGYGDPFYQGQYDDRVAYPAASLNDMSSKLPLIT